MMKRVFLPWNRPILQSAAEFLIEKLAKDGTLDMRNAVLVLPGSRARDRLEEILAETVEHLAETKQLDSAWYPPEFHTLESVPEQFYDLAKPIADDLTQYFAWLRAMDQLDDESPDDLHRFLPEPPKRNDLKARFALGKLLAKIHRELAADDLHFADVEKHCRTLHLENETHRWQTLSLLQKKYHCILDNLSLWDKQSARLFAIKNQSDQEYHRIYKTLKGENKQFYLLGLVDMNHAQKSILKKFWDFVTPVVFAPKTFADRFDEFGCLVPDAWKEMQIDLDDDSQISMVRKPDRQADAVMRRIDQLGGKFSAAEIVVGVPDSEVIPFLEQRFEEAGINSWLYEGKSIKQTAVYRFLEVLAAYLTSPTFAAFAELVRHPGVERFLYEVAHGTDLLSELDQYYNLFLPLHVHENWKENIDPNNPKYSQSFDSLKTAWRNLEELIKSGNIKAILNALFADRKDPAVKNALQECFEVIDAVQSVPSVLMTALPLAETIQLVLVQLENKTIPYETQPDSITMLGWLDVARDDAPVVIVTGMNDGFVPSFLTSDMFLPDTVRQMLGIEDNQLRYARDAYALYTILETRKATKDSAVFLIGGRWSMSGDPLLPSRLFFVADDKTVAKRVQKFFTETKEQEPEITFDKSTKPGQLFGFVVPEAKLEQPVESMSVTEFKDYQTCPYRYYLKHRLRLKSLDDTNEELDALSFGNLIHTVLQQFGDDKTAREYTSPDAVYSFLETRLKIYITEHYGAKPRPVIEIQAERALRRLQAFATWQADWHKAGNRIIETEFAFDEKSNDGRIFLDVDGKKMFLRGRIDRMDRSASGQLIVLDYKTSNKGDSPEETHRKKAKEAGALTPASQWIDFQLPLYHYILKRAGYLEDISLGYIVLPKDAAKTGEKLAEWSSKEILSAIDDAKEIVRSIWDNKFPIAKKPPKYSEEFSAICLDHIVR
jgi:RecB family exonuclease